VSSSNTSGGGGVDLQTLVITAVASAAAAYVSSKVWAPGTLASAAITPVIVALVKEGLAKPADVVTRAVPVRGVVRSAPRADEPLDPIEAFDPEDERVAQSGEIHGSSRALPRHAWKVAVITGLLGFVVAAVIITVPDLVAGKSVFGGGRDTTLFDSHRKSSSPAKTTETQTETAPPVQTTTVPPVETTTVPPAETTTVPPTTTTAPAVPPAQPPPVVPPPAGQPVVP